MTNPQPPNNIKKIHLYDTSAIIFSGQYNRTFRTFNTQGIPTGGLFRLFSILIRDIKRLGPEDRMMLCLDSQQSIRKHFFPYYKASRKTRNPLDKSLITVNFEILMRYLPHLGIPYCECTGLEADDIIYSIVRQNPSKKIILHTDDSDFGSIKRITDDSSNITYQSVSNKDTKTYMEMNSITNKILYGDSSDDVRALPIPTDLKAKLEYALNNNIIPVYRRPITAQDLINVNYPAEYIPITMANIFLIQPKFIEQAIALPPTVVNKPAFEFMFNVLAFKSFMSSFLSKELDRQDKRVMKEFIELQYSIPEEVREYYKEINRQDPRLRFNKAKISDQANSIPEPDQTDKYNTATYSPTPPSQFPKSAMEW